MFRIKREKRVSSLKFLECIIELSNPIFSIVLNNKTKTIDIPTIPNSSTEINLARIIKTTEENNTLYAWPMKFHPKPLIASFIYKLCLFIDLLRSKINLTIFLQDDPSP